MKKEVYTLEDAQNLQKRQYTIQEYRNKMDLEFGYYPERMLSILRDRFHFSYHIMSVCIVCVKAVERSTISKIFPFIVGAIRESPLLLPSSFFLLPSSFFLTFPIQDRCYRT